MTRPTSSLLVPVISIALWCGASADMGLAAGQEPPRATVSFDLDVQPILTARGCNQGACHGKQRGQNGFQLSLWGFDSDFDYQQIVHAGRGRRTFAAAPELSLLLMKATGQVPHGGGVRVDPEGNDYEIIRRWIAEGRARRVPGEPVLERVELSPTERFMKAGEEQPLRMVAFYSDGSHRDVTSHTTYQSSESAVVAVSDEGVVRAGTLPGEATIMARYMNEIATCHVAIPLPEAVPDDLFAQLPRKNFIDELVWDKLRSLGITPSAPCDDATYLRRVHLDVIGRLPTPEEVRGFLSDPDPEKRAKVVERLLERPEYADHWAVKWADLLRPNPYRVGIKAVFNYDDWIRDSFRKNKPYDEFVRELITAEGSSWDVGATVLFRDRRSPDEITTLVSQLFLGVRLECAKCHHHPFEKWSQHDFYSFAAYFARIGRKGTGLSPPISGGEELVFVADSGEVKHPLTGEVLPPRPLFGEAAEIGEGDDPRVALAEWIASPENPYFAQVIVNRVWADLMGRGIVEPVDDLRATNPPTNGPLLEALAESFVASGYDLKQLIRTITASHVYGLSSLPTPQNVADRQNYSRHYRTRLRAEVIADAVDDVTGVRDSFSAMPAASRASQLWTTRVDSIFLDTFGRPNPNQDPPCERNPEATVTQTLHLMNSPQLHQKVTSDAGHAALLAASDLAPEEIVREIYLLVYSRLPEAEEQQLGVSLFDGGEPSRRQACEDLMWALINTPEFSFKD